MSRPIDLDRLTPAELDELSLADLERLWHALERRSAVRAADPELRQAILRRLEEAVGAGRVSRGRAGVIRAELERVPPSVLLDAHRDEILDLHRPALGAFRRPVDDPYRPFKDDPQRLADYMLAGAGVTTDEELLIRAASDLAERAGVPDVVAEPVLVQGLRAVRRTWAEKGVRRGG